MNLKATDKRSQLIEKALELFYNKGIHAVGINEVLQASGVAKKTLYHHFNSKEALIAATVDYRDEKFMGWMQRNLKDVDAGKKSIQAIFHALDDWFNDRINSPMPFRGCFFINTAAEYTGNEDPVFQACQRHKVKVSELFHQHALVIHKDANTAKQLSNTLTLLSEGAIVTAYIQGQTDAALIALQAVNRIMPEK